MRRSPPPLAGPGVQDWPSIDDWLARLASSDADLLVFQNVYDANVAKRLDPDFLPVDGRANARTETREIGLFLRMFHSGLYRCAPLTGILSPKFNEKTMVGGAEFLAFIRRNPGYNVYFINPYPQNAYYSYNVWSHAELCHPGLAGLAHLLFERAGYDTGMINDARDSHATLLYSSYWVGDATFWSGYIGLISRLMEALEELPERLLDRYFQLDPEYPDSVPLLPFIFERTFSTYLHMNPAIRALPYPFARADLLAYCSRFERELVLGFGDVVDEIDRRREYNALDRQFFSGLTRMVAAAARYRWE